MKTPDVILILGCKLAPDNQPKEELVQRVECAVEHWKQTNAPLIMPCGGITPGLTRTEADVMRDLLIERGVPAEIIHLEDRSRTTIENVRNAVKLVGEGKVAALVTSDYHVPRAVEDCIRAGFDTYGVGAVLPDTEYFRMRRAHEVEVTARLNAEREGGLSDEDIARKSVEKMKKLGAVTIEEVEAAKAEK